MNDSTENQGIKFEPLIDITDERQYNHKGVIVPAVSDIVKIAVPSTYDMVDPAVMEKAQEFGKEVHRICEIDDYGKTADAEAMCKTERHLQALLNWRYVRGLLFERYGVPCPTIIEQRFTCPYYGGRPDVIYCFPRVTVVVDRKSGHLVKRALRIQLTGYARLVRDEISKRTPVLAFAASIGKEKTGRLEPVEWAGLENVFLSALTIYNYRNS